MGTILLLLSFSSSLNHITSCFALKVCYKIPNRVDISSFLLCPWYPNFGLLVTNSSSPLDKGFLGSEWLFTRCDYGFFITTNGLSGIQCKCSHWHCNNDTKFFVTNKSQTPAWRRNFGSTLKRNLGRNRLKKNKVFDTPKATTDTIFTPNTLWHCFSWWEELNSLAAAKVLRSRYKLLSTEWMPRSLMLRQLYEHNINVVESSWMCRQTCVNTYLRYIYLWEKRPFSPCKQFQW